MTTTHSIDYRLTPDSELETADIIVGDGQTVFDDTYEYDERILFYFHDANELLAALNTYNPNVGFHIEAIHN